MTSLLLSLALATPAQSPFFPGQGFPGQGFPGQGFPGQGFPGQGFPGQGFPGQGFPGQGFPGQGFPGQGFPGQGFPGQGFPGQPFPITIAQFAATFQPRPGQYSVLFVHPRTGLPVRVNFVLPPSFRPPRVRCSSNSIEFDYDRCNDIEIRFLRNGTVDIDYDD
jgi:hypothetical protein